MSSFGTAGLAIAILSLVAVACSSSSSEPDRASTDAGADAADAAGEALSEGRRAVRRGPDGVLQPSLLRHRVGERVPVAEVGI